MDTSSEFEDYLNNLLFDYKIPEVTELSIVLYKNAMELKKNDNFCIPEEADFVFYSNCLTFVNR